MDQQNVLAVLAEALEVDAETLTLQTPLEDVETYDSAGVLAVMAAVDSRLGVQVSPDALAEAVTVGDLVQAVADAAGA